MLDEMDNMVVLEENMEKKDTSLRFWKCMTGFCFFVALLFGIVGLYLFRAQKQTVYVDGYRQTIAETPELEKSARNLDEAVAVEMRLCYAEWMLGRRDDAFASFETARAMDAQKAGEKLEAVWFATGLYKQHRYKDALLVFEQIVQAQPRVANPYCVYADILATSPIAEVRNAKKAVELAQKGVELAHELEKREALEILAAALAEDGDFDGAVGFQQKALKEDVPKVEGPENLRHERMVYGLRLYQAKIPQRRWPVAAYFTN